MFGLFKRKNRSVVSQEKAIEYQQVAGLVCMDIDLLWDIVNDEDITKEEILLQIKTLVDDKNEIIANKEVRERKWAAANLLFSLPRGIVMSTPLTANDIG